MAKERIKKPKEGFISKSEFSRQNKLQHEAIEADIGHGLPAVKIGKNTYLPTCASELQETVKIFDEEIEGCRTLAFVNHKGGVGKTTNVVNIAASLANLGKRVLMVDMDPQSTLSKRFGIFHIPHFEEFEPSNFEELEYLTWHRELNKRNLYENNITQLFFFYDSEEADDVKKFKKRVKKATIPLSRSQVHGCLDIIPNISDMTEKSEDIGRIPEVVFVMDDILELVRDEYDFILIDLPPRTDAFFRTAQMASDYTVLCFTPEPESQMGIVDLISPIRKLNKNYRKRKKRDIHVLGGIIGKYVPSANVQQVTLVNIRKDIENTLSEHSGLFDTFIHYAPKVSESALGAGAILYETPKSKSCAEYFSLTMDMLQRMIVFEMALKGES